MKSRLPGYRKREIAWAYVFVSIPVLGFLIFGLSAMLSSLGLSFTNWSLLNPPQFVGLSNYVSLFQDPKFFQSFYNTVYLMLGIPIGMFVALILAMMMNRKFKGVAALRTIYYIPVISPIVAVTLLWQWLFNSDFGLINATLQSWFHISGPNWLGDPVWVKPSMILMGTWTGVGSTMILYLAGLQSVSSSYYEAATIDGANAIQKFRYITWPLLSPMHFFIVVTGIIGVFQSFSQIYILWPDGGPQNSAATAVYYIYENAFQYFRMGYASAAAWVLMICILIVTVVQFRLRRRWVFED